MLIYLCHNRVCEVIFVMKRAYLAFSLFLLTSQRPVELRKLLCVSFFYMQTRGRAHDDDAIEKMLNDLSLIKKFEWRLSWLSPCARVFPKTLYAKFCNVTTLSNVSFVHLCVRVFPKMWHTSLCDRTMFCNVSFV